MSALSSTQLIELLVKNKISTQKDLTELAEFAETNKSNFSEVLVQKSVITDEELGNLLGSYYKLPYVELSKLVIAPEAFNSIPFNLAEKHRLIVYSRDSTVLKIATSSPPVDSEILQNIAKKTGLKVEVNFATEFDIDSVLINNRQDLQSTF